MIWSWLALIVSTQASAAGDAKISAELALALRENGVANVMVYLHDRADLTNIPRGKSRADRIKVIYQRLVDQAESSQGPLVELLKKRKAEYRAYHIVNGILLTRANRKLLDEVSDLPSVKAIRLDAAHALRLPPVIDKERVILDDDRNIPANLKAMGVDKVWAELKNKGSGIVIAGQDGGFDWSHPALKRQYRGFHGLGANHNYSWHDAIHRTQFEVDNADCGPDSPVPCDDTGHGTHTMGSMVGDDGGLNRVGVAPEANWIGCRNMYRGNGTVATYLECMEFFLAPYPLGGNARTDGRPDLAPHIMNNSWACPPSEGCKGGEFLEAIRVLHSAGILVVAAAGNDGPGCASMNNAPGFYSGELVSVAAYDHRNGQAADFSSRGPSSWNGGVGPTISAPGSLIRSTVPGGEYDYKSGTSMASPHVAGLLALLWAGKPELLGKVNETIGLLQTSAVPQRSRQTCGSFAGDKQPNAVFGYGLANAFRALTGATN